MSSARFALAEHILHEHFGAAVGLVGSVLLVRGRLAYETLLRLMPITLNQTSVQAALLVLVQHNCLLHFLDDEDGLEYFELDLLEILDRRRYGHFLSLTRERWGKKAAEVVMRVLREGKIRLAILLEDSKTSAARFGDAEYQQTVKIVYEVLYAGLLLPVTRRQHTSDEDQDMQYQKQLLRQIKGVPQAKDLKDILKKVHERRMDLTAEKPEWGQDEAAYRNVCEGLEASELSRQQQACNHDHEDLSNRLSNVHSRVCTSIFLMIAFTESL